MIPDQLKDQLTPSYSNPPQIYGVPKIHKDNNPLRPIVSTIGSPTYRLAKQLARTLSPLAGKGDSFVKNSTHFASDAHTMEIEDGDLLVSFDVVSLFTQVPIDEALKVIEQRLKEDEMLMDRTSIPLEDICELTKLCLKSTFNHDQDQFYEQIEGAAMGSPLSPIIANIYMEHFEEKTLSSAPCTETQGLAEVRG